MSEDSAISSLIWMQRIAEGQDPYLEPEPGAPEGALLVLEFLRDDEGHRAARLAQGWSYWNQYATLPEGQRREDLLAAIYTLIPFFILNAGNLPGPLIAVLAEASIPLARTLVEDAFQSVDLGEASAAVQVWRRVLQASSVSSPRRVEMLTNLSRALQVRFGLNREPADLEEAVRLSIAAANDAPSSHPRRAETLTNLSQALQARFSQSGDRTDLNTAIQAGRAAVEESPPGRLRAEALTNLAQALQARFSQSGDRTDLDAAVQLSQAAVDAVPPRNPRRVKRLVNLSRLLQARFSQSENLTDLNTAIQLSQAAVEESPPGQLRAEALTDLAQAFQYRFSGTGSRTDLDTAIQLSQAAVDAIPSDHLRRPEMLANLSQALQARFSQSGDRTDLDAAVQLSQQVLSSLPDGHPRRPEMLAVQELWTEQQAEHLPRRLVSSGFAVRADASQTVGPDNTLQTGQSYLYWFEISSAPARDAIDAPENRDVPLERSSSEIPLTVALFSFPGEIEISPGEDSGEFIVTADGAVRATQQPVLEPQSPEPARLLFPVRTPESPGRYRLRCNLYCRQTLLQSRLIETEVTSRTQFSEQALISTVDFTVSSSLAPELLAAIQPLRLSVLLNNNGDGTHGFRFWGEHSIKGDAVINGQELQDLLDRARAAYRRTAWNSEDEWRPEWDQQLERYVYLSPPGPQRLGEDLIRMARAGYRLWAKLAVTLSASVRAQLPPGQSPQRSLRVFMRHGPGFVEVATKFSARMVVPTSILYDYPLDTQKDLRVCPDALGAIENRVDLASHQCFTGDCAYYDQDAVVCPGGFWGYRHGIGLPQSRSGQPDGEGDMLCPDAWPEIRHAEKPDFIIGVADDLKGDHVSRVLGLGDAQSCIIDSRDSLLTELRSSDFKAHVVYLFCHGALTNRIPALQVGPRGSEGITQDNIEDGSMYWARTHPLVVLNGCSTAAVEPKYALNLVDAFVRGAFASGVIGTEITVFESLAMPFADEFFTRFLAHDDPVGEAVRRARLRVLAAGNPLGLVYIVYAAPRLQLVP